MHSDNHTPHSLQRKLLLWTVVLVVVPTFVCALWLNQIARRVISDTHARNVTMLGQTLAAALAGRMEGGWSAQASSVLEGLALETRLAFIKIEDADGRRLHDRIIDRDAWGAFVQWRDRTDQHGVIDLEQPIILSHRGELVAIKVPIWNPPAGVSDHQHAWPAQPILEGFVLFALREHGLTQSLAHLRTMQLAAALVICAISLPVVVYVIRRWTAPLRALLQATIQLGAGAKPEPVPVSTKDQLGQLARAFNEMAGNLNVARLDLQQANEELERKVQHRTAELQRVNQRLASEIHDKDEFLRAITHDLATPLRNIDGMASTMLLKYKEHLAEDAVNKLERISANVRAQSDLLNDLLELSRIRTRAGKREPVDVQAVVEQLRDELSFDLECNQITLQIDGHLPTITADRNRMRRLFQNLLDNASKYMLDSADRRITVSHRNNGEFLEFLVADTGCGIDKKDLPIVFQVFRRATHSNSHHVAGRGVGLANVRTIVECFGGNIWVESERGKGTKVFFTLDRRFVHLEQETPSIES